jgi:hypothetical protein
MGRKHMEQEKHKTYFALIAACLRYSNVRLDCLSPPVVAACTDRTILIQCAPALVAFRRTCPGFLTSLLTASGPSFIVVCIPHTRPTNPSYLVAV